MSLILLAFSRVRPAGSVLRTPHRVAFDDIRNGSHFFFFGFFGFLVWAMSVPLFFIPLAFAGEAGGSMFLPSRSFGMAGLFFLLPPHLFF